MRLFSFHYAGDGSRPETDMVQIRTMPGVVVVNEILPKRLILQVTDDLAVQRLKNLSGWVLQESQTVSLDDPFCGLHFVMVPALRLV